jgi:hypothetical protein
MIGTSSPHAECELKTLVLDLETPFFIFKMSVLVLSLFISTLHALPTPPKPASVSSEQPVASSEQFWTSECKIIDIFQEWSTEDSALLEKIFEEEAPFDIELTDTKRLPDAPPFPLSDKTAVVGSVAVPRPHSGKAKSIDSLEINHSHVAILNAFVELPHEELVVATMASNLKVPNANSPRNVKKVGTKKSYYS